jgi:hypothetical protein
VLPAGHILALLPRALAALVALLAAAAPASAACPSETAFDPAVPRWETVNGFELGTRQATNTEVSRYLDAVGAASPHVVLGELARRSWAGRPLPYAIVSRADHLAPRRLESIARTMRAIRGARRTRPAIRRVARSMPGIVNVASNVHGDEPSGTDASMRLLYELAARTDCANVRRLARLVTFILPLQNPDGRAAGTRENAYGFDLNRDWFARTQPETDAKVALLRRYPPLFFIDAHEQAGTAYFFPPNADPIHHEISAEALGAINDTYAPAMKRAAEREGFDYTNYTTYDLFFMGYGDTVPSTAFGAAGMTFEKGGQSPYAEKTAEQFATQDATLTAAAQHKSRLLQEWARQWPRAARQGRAGALEPNLVVQPQNEVRFQVPRVKVFGYFLRADTAAADAARLARRLKSLDVQVYRLRRDAVVRGAHRYGDRGFRSERLPAGTFWIPTAQPQKHWIQALLGEDSYVPFPYFYDVSGWSNPLLMGLSGGFATRPNRRLPARRWRGRSLSTVRGRGPTWRFDGDSAEAFAFVFDLLRAGARVVRAPNATLVTGIRRGHVARLARRRDVALTPGTLKPPPRYAVELRSPKVAVLENLVTLSGTSSGFTEFVLERRFGVETDVLTSAQIDSGALIADGYTAFVVPAGPVPTGGLTPSGLAQIQLFVRGGGRYVGFSRPGLFVAAASGLTLATEQPPPSDYQVPGASFRMLIDKEKVKPLGWGFEEETFVFNVGDPIIAPDRTTSSVAGSYPANGRFFSSGYSEGADALRGTPAAISEEVGSGQSIVFAFDANFRAYTDSTIRMFANAILHPVAGDSAVGGFRLRPGLLARAAAVGREAVIRVPLSGEAELRAAVASAGVPPRARIARDLRGVSLRVPGGRAIDAGTAAWPRRVLESLRRAGVRPNLLVL